MRLRACADRGVGESCVNPAEAGRRIALPGRNRLQGTGKDGTARSLSRCLP